MEPPSFNVLLAGSSGIPGRNILESLRRLQDKKKQQSPQNRVCIFLLKRRQSSHAAGKTEEAIQDAEGGKMVYVDDFSDANELSALMRLLDLDVVISALNAEPAPVLDGILIDALLGLRTTSEEQDNNVATAADNGSIAAGKTFSRKRPLFINGFTLDLLHPFVSTLSAELQGRIAPKVEFAHRLADLAVRGQVTFCTVVNAAFLDYCLMKGYSGVDIAARTAVVYHDAQGRASECTGCSLRFVGDAVALITGMWLFGSDQDRLRVTNQRVRIAETIYSAPELVRLVQDNVPGNLFSIREEDSRTLYGSKQDISFLNWCNEGVSYFKEGLYFGKDDLHRRTLPEIVRDAISEGTDVFASKRG